MAERLSAKLVMFAGEPTHWCPGCEEVHQFYVNAPNEYNGARWSWDGNTENPTFNPSMNIVGRCHYFLHNGVLQFCPDSRHKLSGQTVPLPDIPEDWF